MRVAETLFSKSFCDKNLTKHARTIFSTIFQTILYVIITSGSVRCWHVVGGTRDGFIIEREWLIMATYVDPTVNAQYAKT